MGRLINIFLITLQPPETIAPDQQRTYTLALVFGIISGLAHTVNLVIFAYYGIKPLAYLNIGSVTLFTTAVLLVRLTGRAAAALVLMSTELIVHQGFAVYYLGWEYGFQYFLFPIPGFVFLGQFKNRLVPLSFAAISAALFMWLFYIGQYLLDPHLSGLEHLQTNFFWTNAIGGFIGLAVISIIYSRSAIRIEKELARQNIELRETQLKLVQSEKMAAIGKLVAGVSHEINNPVGAIIANTQTGIQAATQLREQAEDDQAGEDKIQKTQRIVTALEQSLESTATAARRIEEISGRLKGFVHLDEAEVKSTDLHLGIENALALLQDQILNSQIETKLKFEKDLPELICRPAEINQVFMHLLQNAIDAIDGPGTIDIATSHDDKNITIAICDSGRGLTPEKCKSLLDISFSSGTSRIKMGMGLPVSHQIITRHGGELKVQSVPGDGSTFTITLPMNHD